MSNEKLSELSKPVAWAFKDANDVDHASITKKANLYGRHDFQPLYSQECVSALQHESAVNWEAATSLVAENEELKRDMEAKDKRIAELEQRLATPVRLMGEMLLHDWEHSIERQAAFQHRKTAWDARLEEDKKAILAAGFTFTVEGDE